ncbi:MAG: carbohydrate binding family 9 domain-containing protein, partial [Mucilaginibacter sp.]
MKFKSILFYSAFLLLGQQAFCQEIFQPSPIKRKLQATQVTENIKIDGKLDEPEWQLAKPIGDFIQMDPNQGEPARKKTVVRLLSNKNYLYVAAVCYDTVGRDNYRVLNLKRDFTASNSDFFAIAIDGYNDERNAVMFGMNPYGAQRDLLSLDDNYYDPDWDGLWTVRTQRTDTAWIAEVAIPWKTLRYKKNADSLQTWGISFGRIARSSNENSGWPAFPRAYGGLR